MQIQLLQLRGKQGEDTNADNTQQAGLGEQKAGFN